MEIRLLFPAYASKMTKGSEIGPERKRLYE